MHFRADDSHRHDSIRIKLPENVRRGVDRAKEGDSLTQSAIDTGGRSPNTIDVLLLGKRKTTMYFRADNSHRHDSTGITLPEIVLCGPLEERRQPHTISNRCWRATAQ